MSLSAQEAYIDTVIGRAAWPIGGIEGTVNTKKDAYIMRDEEMRKYLHGFNRLITYRERRSRNKN